MSSAFSKSTVKPKNSRTERSKPTAIKILEGLLSRRAGGSATEFHCSRLQIRCDDKYVNTLVGCESSTATGGCVCDDLSDGVVVRIDGGLVLGWFGSNSLR
ncbi:hypothetical protein PC121_g18429 [Phytophthora cactorum]|nr:hypothetical protein PC120_g24313 [Phytophthora cactorum]KAG3050344.1 hypothetical protein PC121_g18429 [Phytophthora cactorum]